MQAKTIALALAFILGISIPTLAQAANGYVTGNVNLRSGPGTQYGQITTIPAGAGVTVRGCLTGYSWCDISFAGRRGWVSSNYLQVVYQNQRRPLVFVGPRIRLPIINHHRPRPPHWKPNRPRPPHNGHRPRPPRPRPQPR